MNPATAVLFCCMANLALGAVIIDPTVADIALSGDLAKPSRIARMVGAAGPFNRFGKSNV
nr:unnamed protein product [Callosobruchus analis]